MPKNDFDRPSAAEPYMDALQAAEFLGASLQSVLRWAALGLIPAHCLNYEKLRAWKFKLSELAAWQFGNGFQLGPKGLQQLRDDDNEYVLNRKPASAQGLPTRNKKIS